MPFLKIHNEAVYDSFTMEGEWRSMLTSMCVRDMWASHLQGHAEQDCCILCTFAVVLKGRKWTNECLCVYFQISLVMHGAGRSFLYILSSLFAKMQNWFISFLQMQMFSLILQATCVWEMAL